MNLKKRRHDFFEQYLDQRDELPYAVKELVQNSLPTGNIKLYGLSDLDDQLKFCENWVLLIERDGIDWLMMASLMGTDDEMVSLFELSRIQKIVEVKSLSSGSLVLIESGDTAPLATIRYTFRQKIIMGHLHYLIEQFIKEGHVPLLNSIDADELYRESMMKPVLEAQNSITTENKDTLWRLLNYLLPYKKELMIGMLGAILMTLVSLVPAYVSGKIIDDVIQPFQDKKLSLHEASEIAWILVITLGLTYLLKEFFVWLRLKKMSILGESVARDLRRKLYDHLQTLSMDFYSKKQTGSIIARVSSDTDRIWDFVAFGVVEVSIALIMMMSLSAVLISLDWRLGLMMSLPVPFLLFKIYRHGEEMKKMFIKAWRKWSDVTAVLSDTIPGIQVVKAFNQEEREKGKFNKRNDIVTSEFNNIHIAWTKFWPLLMLGIHIVIMMVWVCATPRLISFRTDDAYLSAGTFVSFLLYMTMFSQPIEVIGQVARMLNRALSSAHRIFEILDTKATITDCDRPLHLSELNGDIKFENVFFSYDSVRFILKDLSFHIKSGEMVGLVGTSGGGKSTITKLLTRFYDVNSGQILIDGHDIKKLEIGSFRRQVGMVLQEPYLFHGTIRDNISYGVPEASHKEIIDAACIANVHNFISKLAHGYDTVIGERGHTLSGGERQRVSIARAVLANPRILILDEATSAVDTETERNIQDALDRLIEGRTVISIAHRLSTLRKADRILVVGNGGIVESGTHDELLTKDEGDYLKLHRMQKEMSEAFGV